MLPVSVILKRSKAKAHRSVMACKKINNFKTSGTRQTIHLSISTFVSLCETALKNSNFRLKMKRETQSANFQRWEKQYCQDSISKVIVYNFLVNSGDLKKGLEFINCIYESLF